MHDQNCFITLTYNNENLPHDRSVSKIEFQSFMKALRHYLTYPGPYPKVDKAMRIQYYTQKWHKNYGEPKLKNEVKEVKFYGCGEYGDKLGRPHYHLLLFGYEFPDTKILSSGRFPYFRNAFKQTKDCNLYTSQTLEKIWGKGFVTIGECNFKTAGYVARYCMKKIYGEMALDHYQGRMPEFALMSKGIGRSFYNKYKTDLYPKDFITHDGRKWKPPKYYDYILEQEDPELLDYLRKIREEKAGDFNDHVEEAKRKKYKEKYKLIITKQLNRIYENQGD